MVLLEAVLEVVGVAGVVGAVTAAQDIDPETHGGGVGWLASFEMASFDFAPLARRYAQDERVMGYTNG